MRLRRCFVVQGSNHEQASQNASDPRDGLIGPWRFRGPCAEAVTRVSVFEWPFSTSFDPCS